VRAIDHALIALPDLQGGAEALCKIGFTLSPYARHQGWATANRCIFFQQSPAYVELIGLAHPSPLLPGDNSRAENPFTQNLATKNLATENLDIKSPPQGPQAALPLPDGGVGARLASQGPGLFSLAFEGAVALDALPGFGSGFAAYCAAYNIPLPPPQRLSRPIAAKVLAGLAEPLPEAALRFHLQMLPEQLTPGIKAFICEHLTRQWLSHEDWQAHANGARALMGLTWVVEAPGDYLAFYERLCADHAQISVRQGFLAITWPNGQYLHLLAPWRLARRYPGQEALPKSGGVVVSILVENLEKSREFFHKNQLPTQPALGRRVVLPRHIGQGVVWEFIDHA
jgi:Glyoxalase-like domain